MATQLFATGNTATATIWSRKVEREVLKKTLIARLIGNSSDSVVQVKDELSKAAGDTIRIPLQMQLASAGVLGTNNLENNEDIITYYHDNLVINQLRNAVRFFGGISDQRVVFDQRENAKVGLSDWGADRLDYWFLNQVCGNSAQTDTRYTGLQAVTTISKTADANHYINAETPTIGGASNDEDLDSSGDTFQLGLIDEALRRAKTLNPAIRPVRISGGDYYILVLNNGAQTDASPASNSVNCWDLPLAA